MFRNGSFFKVAKNWNFFFAGIELVSESQPVEVAKEVAAGLKFEYDRPNEIKTVRNLSEFILLRTQKLFKFRTISIKFCFA